MPGTGFHSPSKREKKKNTSQSEKVKEGEARNQVDLRHFGNYDRSCAMDPPQKQFLCPEARSSGPPNATHQSTANGCLLNLNSTTHPPPIAWPSLQYLLVLAIKSNQQATSASAFQIFVRPTGWLPLLASPTRY